MRLNTSFRLVAVSDAYLRADLGAARTALFGKLTMLHCNRQGTCSECTIVEEPLREFGEFYIAVGARGDGFKWKF